MRLASRDPSRSDAHPGPSARLPADRPRCGKCGNPSTLRRRGAGKGARGTAHRPPSCGAECGGAGARILRRARGVTARRGGVVETLFAYPGLGQLTFIAIESRDYPLLEALFLLFGVSIIAVGLASDLLLARLDPRPRARSCMTMRSEMLPRTPVVMEDPERPQRYSAPILHDARLWLGVAMLVGILATVSLGGRFVPYDPHALSGRPMERPSSAHLLGTNDIGQDLFSQVVRGGRVSITVGFGAAILSTAIAWTLGLLSGLGRRWSAVVAGTADLFLALPFLPITILVVAHLGPSPAVITFTVGLVSWPAFARVMRARVASELAAGYIEAAHAIGAHPCGDPDAACPPRDGAGGDGEVRTHRAVSDRHSGEPRLPRPEQPYDDQLGRHHPSRRGLWLDLRERRLAMVARTTHRPHCAAHLRDRPDRLVPRRTPRIPFAAPLSEGRRLALRKLTRAAMADRAGSPRSAPSARCVRLSVTFPRRVPSS